MSAYPATMAVPAARPATTIRVRITVLERVIDILHNSDGSTGARLR